MFQNYINVVDEVIQVLNERIEVALTSGIPTWNLIVDPGIGFAKDKELNLQILRDIRKIKAGCGHCPILVNSISSLVFTYQ